jgi:hypothetical protein
MSAVPVATLDGAPAPEPAIPTPGESAATTPGFPGAYPKGQEDPNASKPSDVLNKVDLQSTITSVGQTAKSYLPASVTSYFGELVLF